MKQTFLKNKIRKWSDDAQNCIYEDLENKRKEKRREDIRLYKTMVIIVTLAAVVTILKVTVQLLFFSKQLYVNV